MAKSSVLLCFGLCFLATTLSHHGAEAYRQGPRQQQPWRLREGRDRCDILSLTPHEPNHRVQHEAGVTEMWEQTNDQMQCANVAATRHVIEPNGLLLPNFNNAPMLAYIVEGRGILGTMMPGCPETYESFQGRRGRRMRSARRARAGQVSMDDEHQKLHFFNRGDIVALPAGVAHWCYNDGETQLVMVVVHDMASIGNQLDQQLRRFFLAGNPLAQAQQTTLSRERRYHTSLGGNIFRGFDIQLLAIAFGVSPDTAQQLQSENDPRGAIVRVNEGLRLVRPPSTMRQRIGIRWNDNHNSTTDEAEGESEAMMVAENANENDEDENGLEETICSQRLIENMEDPERADVYSVRGGRIRSVTNFDLPILNFIQLSAKRGYLYRNAMMTPQWNMNSHEVIYCIRGSARVQIVGGGSSTTNRPVFDGELREGQLIVVPQNFASVAMAGEEGFEWITFMTSENAISSPLAGRTSVMRGMPEEVIMNMFMISRDEARRLKYNRPEMTILSPRGIATRGIRATA